VYQLPFVHTLAELRFELALLLAVFGFDLLSVVVDLEVSVVFDGVVLVAEALGLVVVAEVLGFVVVVLPDPLEVTVFSQVEPTRWESLLQVVLPLQYVPFGIATQPLLVGGAVLTATLGVTHWLPLTT
jgi:hypothetical protein